jgi:hypothetical protein
MPSRRPPNCQGPVEPVTNDMAICVPLGPDVGQHTSPRGRQREAQQPVTQQERAAANRLGTTMAAALSYRGCDGGRQDRSSPPGGLGPVPFDGSGGDGFPSGGSRWRRSSVPSRARGGGGLKQHRGAFDPPMHHSQQRPVTTTGCSCSKTTSHWHGRRHRRSIRTCRPCTCRCRSHSNRSSHTSGSQRC